MKELASGAIELTPSLIAVVKIEKKKLIYGRTLCRLFARDSVQEVRVIPGWSSTGCGNVACSQYKWICIDNAPSIEVTKLAMLFS